MTTYTIPLPPETVPNYSYTIGLDGKDYKINYRFDVLRNSWYLAISKLDKTLLLSNLRIVPWLDLLSQYTKEDLPLGKLILIPVSYEYPTSPNITLENLSTEFQLVYESVT